MAKPTASQIASMKKLGMTDAEIAQLIQDDAKIEKGEKMPFDLTDEQMKESKKYTKSTTKRKAPPNYKLDNQEGKRSRKENPTKGAIIAEIAKFLEISVEDVSKSLLKVQKKLDNKKIV